jgi:hypothetical protein
MPPKKPFANSPMKENPSHGNRLCKALGIIVPVEWDLNGNPSAWAISTYDENLYRIDTATEKGRILGSFLGRKMLLSGLLDEAEDSQRKILVETYVLLDDRQPIR